MELTVNDIAGMMDLSCVQTNSNENDIKLLAEIAKKYNGGHVSVMQTFISEVKELLKDRQDIKVIGNVSFPSGSDSTTMKVAQAKEMIAEGCNEIDMVMNIGKLLSGKDDEVESDVRTVVDTVKSAGLPIKVIIEYSLLSKREVEKACEICVRCGATFVKTGTGWMPKGTTIEDVKFIKSIVGDTIKIKASGHIRDLDMLIKMYKAGARRFGVNVRSGKRILEECIALGGKITI